MDSDVSVKDAVVEEVFKGSLEDLSVESSDSVFELFQSEPGVGSKKQLYKAGLYSPGSGEVCAKYISMSASSVLRHPYYNYPSIKDPGIEQALYHPEIPKIYAKDGQELYLDLCKEMNMIPCRLFHRGLVTDTIDLKFYGVNPISMRAMAMALAENTIVKRLDLTSNFLDTRDACYHIGRILGDKNAITELVLRQCNLGYKYLNQVLYFLYTRKMDLLDLSENHIENTGFKYLIDQIFQGAVIKKIILRENRLTSEGLVALADVIEFHDHTEVLDLSWNVFFEPEGPTRLVRALRASNVLTELDLSYTGLTLGVIVGALLRIKHLKILNLSNNRLTTRAAKIITKNLSMASKLQILNLSSNPFTPQEALGLLLALKDPKVKVKQLLMDTIGVGKEFLTELKAIRKLSYRRRTVITYGNVHGNYTISTVDLKVIYLKQLVQISTRESKKKKKRPGEEEPFDLLVYFLERHKTGLKELEVIDFLRVMKRSGFPVEFVVGLVNEFPGTKSSKEQRPINLELLVDYIHRIYPEKKAPPTPPPSLPAPEPEPPPPKKAEKKKKGK